MFRAESGGVWGPEKSFFQKLMWGPCHVALKSGSTTVFGPSDRGNLVYILVIDPIFYVVHIRKQITMHRFVIATSGPFTLALLAWLVAVPAAHA